MAEYLEIDSFDQLISAVKNYRDELGRNQAALRNAANICDQAMGSDDIAKKQIAKLEIALIELDNAQNVVQTVLDSLIEDRRQALEIDELAGR